MSDARARFPWGLTIVCGLALAVLLALGAWQVQRMQWKQGLIARAEAAEKMPVAPLAEAFPQEFRRVSVSCRGLASAPFVEVRSVRDGAPGVRLISTCHAEKFAFPILIDRGFVADAVSARPPVVASDADTAIEGQLREIPSVGMMTPGPEGRTFYALDPQPMGRLLGESSVIPPLVIYATTSSNPEWPDLRPSAPPAAFSNNHLGYALTWFGLALALVGFYIALLRRKPLNQPRSASEATGKEERS